MHPWEERYLALSRTCCGGHVPVGWRNKWKQVYAVLSAQREAAGGQIASQGQLCTQSSFGSISPCAVLPSKGSGGPKDPTAEKGQGGGRRERRAEHCLAAAKSTGHSHVASPTELEKVRLDEDTAKWGNGAPTECP